MIWARTWRDLAARESVWLGRVGGRGGRRGWIRLGELRVVEGDVGFDFGGGDFLNLVGIRGGGLDEEGIFEAVDFAKIPEIGFPGQGLVTNLAHPLPLHD